MSTRSMAASTLGGKQVTLWNRNDKHKQIRLGHFEVAGEAGNGEEAVRLARTLHPAVALMDMRMPALDGVAATHRQHRASVFIHLSE